MAKEDQKANQGKPETNSHKPGGLKIGFGKVDGNGKRVVRVFNINLRRLAIWALILLLFIPSLLSLFGNFAFKKLEIPLSQAIADIRDGKVQKVDVSDQELLLYYREPLSPETQGLPNIKSSRKEPTESLSEILNREGIDPQTVEIDVRGGKISGGDWLSIGTNVLFFVGLALFFLWMMRQARGAQDSMFGFGKSNARLFTKGKQNVRFQDVGGLKEAKQEVEEIVDFLKNPKKYQKLGARTPKGVLLIGQSGTGKTLLARAIAGEADVPFYSMAGSEFMEMLVGVGASVTGDTPILVRDKNKTELVEIGKFIDQFYKDKQLNIPVPVSGVQTLGLHPEINKFWGSRSASRPVFGGSAWQDVDMVFRHRANEIYEIDYLGGNLRTTGDHSVFVRENGGIRAKEVRKLKSGDILVNLPMNTRAWDADKKHTVHQVKQHEFPEKAPHVTLDVWRDDPAEIAKYEFAVAQHGVMTQSSIAAEIGVSQMTVSHWQNGVHGPQKLSKKLVKLDLPEKVAVTKELCKLFGYFVAEGRGASGPEFTFNINEGKYVEEVADLVSEIFGLTDPVITKRDDNSVRIIYRSKHLGRFFEAHCGAGAHHKHIPDWLWDMPRDYFLAFLEGYSNGDGYITKSEKLSMSSVSQQLIRELAWLCSMHGIKVGVKHEIIPAGRIIRDKPLPATESWNLIIGKTSNPFIDSVPRPYQFKRCIVKAIRRRQFDGFVYDLCGVDHEAFFGGEKPILLHNSRVRDLFQTAKAHAPSIIFIDEIDAIGQARGGAFTGGHGEREQTLNQILVEMDGFTPTDNVIVCAASVTGDTPVMVKKNNEVSLRPIGEVIDEYYKVGESNKVIDAEDIEVLGLVEKHGISNLNRHRLYFGGSKFVHPSGVYRHKVDHVYEISYLGGTIRATGNHSVFVRTRWGIQPKEVRQLKQGDILVELPMKVNRTTVGRRQIRAHVFGAWQQQDIEIYEPTEDQQIWHHQYLYAQHHNGKLSQTEIAKEIGVEQTTISAWLRGKVSGPRSTSREYFNHKLAEKIKVTPTLARLLGYYVAEGYSRKELDFCFAIDEADYIDDVISLMRVLFGLEPDRIRHVTPGAVNIVYYCAPIARLFARLCGSGAHRKHVPAFLFEAPLSYYQEFLLGYFRGDGHLDGKGRGEITSVSSRLILELNWLSAMHGITTYVRRFTVPAGRKINNGKGLPQTEAWRIGWGKTMNPWQSDLDRARSATKRAIVLQVKKIPYEGYVYDFVGCEGEAFFGGTSPLLLHNTNRPDVLDSALVRPGRFDRRVVLDLPDMEERLKILQIHAKNKPFVKGFSWDKVAKRTVGFSGADLENMLNESAILAARRNAVTINMADVDEAATKVKLGPERKRLQSELERKMTAYHEAGHAIVAHFLPRTDPVNRISIVSRGMTLGFTEMMPLSDKVHQTKSELIDKMAAMLGGRAAEELVFNEMTGGASSDIQHVTQVAQRMVVDLGMSDLGPIDFGPQYDVTEYGLRSYDPVNVSDKTQEAIDREVQRFVNTAHKQATEILKRERKALDSVSGALMEHETLDGDQFEKKVGKPKAAISTNK